MNRMRLRIAERLKESQNSAASLTTFNEIDMSKLMAFRAKYKDAVLKEDGVKLGYMSAFARASVLALREIPAANASIEGPNGPSTATRFAVPGRVPVTDRNALSSCQAVTPSSTATLSTSRSPSPPPRVSSPRSSATPRVSASSRLRRRSPTSASRPATAS